MQCSRKIGKDPQEQSSEVLRGKFLDWAKEDLRIAERLREAPDLAWSAAEGAAHEKRAKALREYAEEEAARVENLLKAKTSQSQ